MGRFSNKLVEEMVVEDKAYIGFFNNEDGSVDYYLEDTRSRKKFPNDLKLSRNMFQEIFSKFEGRWREHIDKNGCYYILKG